VKRTPKPIGHPTLSQWLAQNNTQTTPSHRYCAVCGTPLNADAEETFCHRHRRASAPNTLLMDGELFLNIYNLITRINTYYWESDFPPFRITNQHTTNAADTNNGEDDGFSGVHFRFMDSSHISLTDIKLHSGGFPVFNFNSNQTVSIDLTSDAAKAIKRLRRGDQLLLHVEENQVRATLLHADTEVTLTLHRNEAEWDPIPDPTVHYTADFEISTQKLYRIVKSISQSQENVAIHCDPKTQTLKISGTDDNEETNVHTFTPASLPALNINQQTLSHYDSTTLTETLQHITPHSKTLRIHLAQDMPLKLTTTLTTTKTRKAGTLTYHLAPRVFDT